jgi:hypothetical protein
MDNRTKNGGRAGGQGGGARHAGRTATRFPANPEALELFKDLAELSS